jgi:hypothetical protein
MPENSERTSVDIVRAGDEELKWLAQGNSIFYKSDTQGFDEVIATSLSADFGTKFAAASSSFGASLEKSMMNTDS